MTVDNDNGDADIKGKGEVSIHEDDDDKEAREFWEGLHDDQEAYIKQTDYVPTDKEVEEHEATHIPYRSWCQFCVQGKGKESKHGRSDGVSGVAIGIMDYMFLGEKKEDRDEEEGTMPVLSYICRKTGH